MSFRFSVYLLPICHSCAGPRIASMTASEIASIDLTRAQIARKRRPAMPSLATWIAEPTISLEQISVECDHSWRMLRSNLSPQSASKTRVNALVR
jgi:hypothetical protein